MRWTFWGLAMTKPVNKYYFDWLVGQIENRSHGETFLDLFRHLYNTGFVWMVPGDDNRAQDALDLRGYFQTQAGDQYRIPIGPPSILEVAIALSRKVAHFAGGEPTFWAWQVLENLGLMRWHDPISKDDFDELDRRLEGLIWRTFSPDGDGGFFPLNNPPEDQRTVEIWHQMHAYINEINEPS